MTTAAHVRKLTVTAGSLAVRPRWAFGPTARREWTPRRRIDDRSRPAISALQTDTVPVRLAIPAEISPAALIAQVSTTWTDPIHRALPCIDVAGPVRDGRDGALPLCHSARW